MSIGDRTRLTLTEFAAEMEATKQRIRDLPIGRDLEEPVKEIIYRGVAFNYDHTADADGNTWAPHAPATIAMHGPHPLLVVTGRMKASTTMSGQEGNFEEVTDNSIRVGTDIPYAAAQQFGTDKIPARPFFELSDPFIDEIENAAVEYLIAQI